MQRRMMAVLALMTMMVLSMAVGPKATMAAGRQAAPTGARPAAFGPEQKTCWITGENYYQYCSGPYTIYPNEQVRICVKSTTKGYAGNFVLYDAYTGGQVGNVRTISPPSGCSTLYTNTTSRSVSVNLWIDSLSYYWNQDFVYTIESYRV